VAPNLWIFLSYDQFSCFCFFESGKAAFHKFFAEKFIMGPEALYAELKQLAEKLQVNVSEQNLLTTGIKVNSGFCIVTGQSVFIMDKHKPIRTKTKLLAQCLSRMAHKDIYVVPAVRELLNKYAAK